MSNRWEVQRFGDVCDFVRGPFGGSLKKNIFRQEGYAVYEQRHAIYDQFENIRYFIDNDKFIEMARFELKPYDLIMSCSGTMGKIAIVPEGIPKGIINQALLKLSPKELLHPKFLKLWMESRNFQEQIEALSQGAAIQNMASVKILKEIKVPTPELPEQKRIVAILDQAFAEIDKARANAEQNLKNARELFESYLQQVFSQRGEGWPKTYLGEIADVSSGGTPRKSNSEYWEGDIPWYSSGELNNTYTDKSKELITDVGLRESNAKLFPAGSLLIGMYDTAALKMSILDRDGAFNQAVAGVKPNKNINLVFILHSINHIKPELLKLRRGVRQKNLNQSKIKGIPIGLPSIEEQNIVVSMLKIMKLNSDELANKYKRKIVILDELKKSILQKAFTGELTQNNHDAAA